MRIFDIEIYRDGGSIEFLVERDGHTYRVRLETPFRGEPRALRIGPVPVSRGDVLVSQFLADVAEWWATLSESFQKRVQEVMNHKGPFYNPDAETMHAIGLSRVLYVRDYVIENYAT
jgi:hypothetical protein